MACFILTVYNDGPNGQEHTMRYQRLDGSWIDVTVLGDQDVNIYSYQTSNGNPSNVFLADSAPFLYLWNPSSGYPVGIVSIVPCQFAFTIGDESCGTLSPVPVPNPVPYWPAPVPTPVICPCISYEIMGTGVVTDTWTAVFESCVDGQLQYVTGNGLGSPMSFCACQGSLELSGEAEIDQGNECLQIIPLPTPIESTPASPVPVPLPTPVEIGAPTPIPVTPSPSPTPTPQIPVPTPLPVSPVPVLVPSVPSPVPAPVTPIAPPPPFVFEITSIGCGQPKPSPVPAVSPVPALIPVDPPRCPGGEFPQDCPPKKPCGCDCDCDCDCETGGPMVALEPGFPKVENCEPDETVLPGEVIAPTPVWKSEPQVVIADPQGEDPLCCEQPPAPTPVPLPTPAQPPLDVEGEFGDCKE